jgi:superfamily II DNA or RNA helicase
LKWIADYTQSLDGNTLILVDRIETGEFLTNILSNSVFINGQMKIKDRKIEFKDINVSTDKNMVATFGTLSTGVNLPKIHNLVLVEAGKSFVRTIQSAGRLLRRAEGKDFANIYDVCSNLKYSKTHLTKRKSFFKEADYPFTMSKIKYR